MEKTNVESLFESLDKMTETIQQHENETYLDSLAIVLDIIFQQEVPETIDDILSYKLQNLLKKIDPDTYHQAELRKAIQLAILKGMKTGTQDQHLMTPETVALLVGYLAEKLSRNLDDIRLFDPASGTGNLLTSVITQLRKPVAAYASEIDPTLLKLALHSANLQKMEITFFHQDSLQPFLLDPVDLVVADLPVGYYPDDLRASKYELKSDEGHSYAHHLFIEQSMHYVKKSGYLIFVVPNFIFASDQAAKFHAYVQKTAHTIGVLQLPISAFKSEANAKSILILQKKDENSNPPKQPLLVKLPSFKNSQAMEDILVQMNNWFKTYKS